MKELSSNHLSCGRNKYMQLQSEMSSMQCRTRDMMVCQGAEVSGAAVSLNNVSSRLRALIAKLVQDYSITEADLEVGWLLMFCVYIKPFCWHLMSLEKKKKNSKLRIAKPNGIIPCRWLWHLARVTAVPHPPMAPQSTSPASRQPCDALLRPAKLPPSWQPCLVQCEWDPGQGWGILGVPSPAWLMGVVRRWDHVCLLVYGSCFVAEREKVALFNGYGWQVSFCYFCSSSPWMACDFLSLNLSFFLSVC